MAGRNGTRVVVTGMGALSPIGNNVSEFWDNAVAGNSGIDYLKAFDTTNYPIHIAGEVKDFDPEQYMDRREARRQPRIRRRQENLCFNRHNLGRPRRTYRQVPDEVLRSIP